MIYVAATDAASWGKADRVDQAIICAIGFAREKPTKVSIFAIDTDDMAAISVNNHGQLLYPAECRVKELGNLKDAEVTCRMVHAAWKLVRNNVPRIIR